MSSFESLIRFGFSTKFPKWPKESNLSVLPDKVLAVARDFAAELARLEQSDKLTETGKRDARAELGENFLQKLEGLKHFIPSFDAEKLRREIHAALTTDKSVDPQVQELRAQELRRRLLEKDNATRHELFRKAVENEHVDFVAAIVADPLRELLPERVVAEGLKILSERRNPEKVKELARVEETQAILAASFGDVEAGIRSLSGLQGSGMRERFEEQNAPLESGTVKV